MKIPFSGRKKALCLVDVQPAFLKARNRYVVNNIKLLLRKIPYDLYLVVSFHTEKGSVWERQQQHQCLTNNSYVEKIDFKNI